MDTNNKELAHVLQDLYSAVVRLVELVNPQGVTDEMKLKLLINQLQSITSGIGLSSISSITPEKGEKNEEQTHDKPKSIDSQAPKTHAQLVKTGYATSPYPNESGFIFRRLAEDSESKFFKIDIYDDDSCTFELVGLNNENLQFIKDNQSQLLPTGVATCDGHITDNCSVRTISLGKARQQGRVIYIESPMVVKFESIPV